MTNPSVPQGTVDAARTILAAGTRLNVHLAHDIILREIDANEDEPQTLHLIPLGPVLAVGITKDGAIPKDEDLIFVSLRGLVMALPAMGVRFDATSGGVATSVPLDLAEAVAAKRAAE